MSGLRALLIEDLVTTGGSSLSGVKALRAAGATVTDVLAIVSYGFAEAERAFAKAELRLHTLTDFPTILHAAGVRDKLDADQIAIVQAWLEDPAQLEAQGMNAVQKYDSRAAP